MNIYVGNLPFKTNGPDLERLFGEKVCELR